MRRNADDWISLARRYMNYCFRTASVPRVDELATMLSMSREALTRAFHAATGRPPAETFRCMQIRRARHLLTSTEMPTAEIARAAAFGSDRAFYRAFLRCTGVTPTAYRRTKRHRSANTTQPSAES